MTLKNIFCLRTAVVVLSVFFLQTVPANAKNNPQAEAKLKALNEKIQSYGEQGNLAEAIKAGEEALVFAKKEFGGKKKEAAKAMNNLANLYLYAAREPEAEALYQNTILIELKEYGKESSEVAASYYNLGIAYAVQKKYKTAREILQRALDIREKKLGPDHADTQKTRKMISEFWDAEHPNAEVIV